MGKVTRYDAGFIGCGNMGGTLVRNCARSVGGERLCVCDSDQDKVDRLCGEYGCDDADIGTLVELSDFVFLGLKPQVMAGAVSPFAASFAKNPDCTVVSMAAGMTVADIRSIVGDDHKKIIRIMPNLCCGVGEGMILVSTDGGAGDDEIDRLEELLGDAGRFEIIPESLMDAGCALSGSGPAFAFIFIEALADAGVSCGLSRKSAVKLAAQTVLGSARSVLDLGADPAELKNRVTSPAGTTAEGIFALERGGFRAAAMSAVRAAFEKAGKLKK